MRHGALGAFWTACSANPGEPWAVKMNWALPRILWFSPSLRSCLGGRRGWLPVVVVLAGTMTYALTTSRASVLLGLTGLVLVWLLSSLTQFSGRKLGVVTVGLVALAVVSPIVMTSFDARFAHSKFVLDEDAECLAFKRATWMMLEEYPGGVGPNNFALVGNTGGYYNRSGGISSLGRSSNVHNLYRLVLSETGPLGLVSFILLLASPLVMALRYGLFGRLGAEDPKRDFLIGASVRLLIVYVHSIRRVGYRRLGVAVFASDLIRSDRRFDRRRENFKECGTPSHSIKRANFSINPERRIRNAEMNPTSGFSRICDGNRQRVAQTARLHLSLQRRNITIKCLGLHLPEHKLLARAMIVVSYHMALLFGIAGWPQVLYLFEGKAAVIGFLAISGFSIHSSLNNDPSLFLKRRFLRIYPHIYLQ